MRSVLGLKRQNREKSQWIWPQSCSSELSQQSLTPSHSLSREIQREFAQRNSLLVQLPAYTTSASLSVFIVLDSETESSNRIVNRAAQLSYIFYRLKLKTENAQTKRTRRTSRPNDMRSVPGLTRQNRKKSEWMKLYWPQFCSSELSQQSSSPSHRQSRGIQREFVHRNPLQLPA